MSPDLTLFRTNSKDHTEELQVLHSFDHCPQVKHNHRQRQSTTALPQRSPFQVLVLDDGKVVEFDSPSNLLMNKDSVFTKLVEATGSGSSANLRKIANKESRIFEDDEE